MRRWDEEGGMEVLVGDTFVSRPMSGGYKHPDSDRPPPLSLPTPVLGSCQWCEELISRSVPHAQQEQDAGCCILCTTLKHLVCTAPGEVVSANQAWLGLACTDGSPFQPCSVLLNRKWLH